MEFGTTQDVWTWDATKSPMTRIRPTHVAILDIRLHGHWMSRSPFRVPTTEALEKGILDTASGRLLSRRQRAFMNEADAVGMYGHQGAVGPVIGYGGHARLKVRAGRYEGSGGGPPDYAVYGVTAQDARAMAKALLEWFQDEALAHVQRELNDARGRLASQQALLDTASAEHKQASEKLTKQLEKEYYVSREHARESQLDMGKQQRLIKIDIAAIQARIEAIKQIENDTQRARSQAVNDALETLKVEQDVAMAGALAKKAAAQKQREHAKTAWQAQGARGAIGGRIGQLRERVRRAQGEVRDRERLLADPIAAKVKLAWVSRAMGARLAPVLISSEEPRPRTRPTSR